MSVLLVAAVAAAAAFGAPALAPPSTDISLAPYSVERAARAELAKKCGDGNADTSNWTACGNIDTRTVYLDMNDGPALSAWAIIMTVRAMDIDIRGAYVGDPMTCGGCLVPIDVAKETQDRLASHQGN